MISQTDPGTGLIRLSWALFAITAILFIAILILFDEKPPTAPSAAATESAEYNLNANYYDILKTFFFDVDFVFLFVTYGINVGVFYAVSTLLEQVINIHFPESTKEAGQMGLLLTLAGTIGSVICGIILDKTHLFKMTTLMLYILSLLGMIIFTAAVYLPVIWPMYFVSAFLGFFMTGYLPIGKNIPKSLSKKMNKKFKIILII